MANWIRIVKLKDVWHNDDLPFEKKRDKIVERIKESGWRDITPYPDTFDERVADLTASSDTSEFDSWFNELYDLADSDRVWIETF